ncbi:MAG TPA: glycosyltransferase family A protein [Bacteroidales bacterium]|nr:glycosyltransferase family A protein [Bacteroidales bacterium]
MESVQERIEVLKLAIKHFYRGVEVIVVEQALNGKFYFMKKLDNVVKIPIEYPVFNKSWCVNVGVKAATNDYVAICDCDMFARETCWSNLLEWMVSCNHMWAFGWNRLIRTTRIQRNIIVEGGNIPSTALITPVPGYHEGGIFVVKKEFFYKVGQFNECMVELGGIDNSIANRCRYYYNYYPMYQLLVYHMCHIQKPKKKRPTRKTNIKILKKEKSQTQKSIAWLVAQNQGNKKSPLSHRKNFLDELL